MKKTRRAAEKAISQLLAPHGFVKQGSYWILAVEENHLGVNLQGSRFNKGQAFLNFEAWYGALNATPFVSFKESGYHLSFRADSAIEEEIQRELTFDDSEIQFDEYVSRLGTLFVNQAVKKLLGYSNLESAVKALRSRRRPGLTAPVLWQAAFPEDA